MLGLNLSGTTDNSDVVEEDWNDYETTGGRLAALWQINPQWDASLSLITQYSDTNGDWLTDPAVGDYKIVSFYDEYRDDDWYQASASIKGDLGFAELTATASWFERDIEYQWDNTLYENWRTAILRDSRFALRHGLSRRHDVQLPGAESLDLRGPADVAGREPIAVDGRRLLRGRLGLVALRRERSLASRRRRAWYTANYLRGYPTGPTTSRSPPPTSTTRTFSRRPFGRRPCSEN